MAKASEKNRSQRGRNARYKGAQFERDVANAFADALGIKVKRGIQSRDGKDACDVEGTSFWVEVKRGKNPNPRAALAQAITDTDGRTPIAVIRDDGKRAFVVLRFDDFLDLVK